MCQTLGLNKVARGEERQSSEENPEYWNEHQKANHEIVLEDCHGSMKDIHSNDILLGLSQIAVVIGYLLLSERIDCSNYCDRKSKEEE